MAFTQSARPLAMEEWFQAMPEVLSPASWSLALARPKAQLWHRSCPWGGHLIKFDLKGIQIQNAPQKTGNLIVRPEVRASMQMGGDTRIHRSEFVAPGEAILVGRTCNFLFRLLNVLFGDTDPDQASAHYFFHDALCPVEVHQKVCRDYPLEGDSSIAFWQGGRAFHGFMVIRPENDAAPVDFNVVYTFRVPQDKFASWATFQYRKVLETVHRATEWFLNRPNIQRLREIDQSFYVVLSIQSFKRGLPMVPCNSQPLVTIDAGERLGLPQWRRYKTNQQQNPRKCKFNLAEYIKMLLNAIGEDIQVFDTLDGRELVSYQCVVRRSDWDIHRNRFAEVFPLAKAAYRRANGGTYAPSIQEDAEVKFHPQDQMAGAEYAGYVEQLDAEPRLVVRNTFLDLEEQEGEGDRPARRSRTVKLNISL